MQWLLEGEVGNPWPLNRGHVVLNNLNWNFGLFKLDSEAVGQYLLTL